MAFQTQYDSLTIPFLLPQVIPASKGLVNIQRPTIVLKIGSLGHTTLKRTNTIGERPVRVRWYLFTFMDYTSKSYR
jgi:hypothetical protein